MGEIWVSESGQDGRIWAIRRKRKDFYSLYFFSSWNIYALWLYSTEKVVANRVLRRPNVGRSAARRQVGQDGTSFEATDGFFRDELGDFGWVDTQDIE